MIKNFVLAICLILSLSAVAQEGTSSPYSFYGLGEMRFKGTVENRSMGQLSVLSDSIHLNLQNPAFFPDLKYTTFTIGTSYMTTKLETTDAASKARRSTLDYLALAFPIGKFGASFGLMPFTSVGYKISVPATTAIPTGKEYTGTGGINRAFVGGGYEVTKHFSIGAELGYHFGNIETSSLYKIADVQLGTREQNKSAVSGAGMTGGISYKSKFGKKLQFFASSTFSPATTLSFSNQRKIATVQFLNTGGIRVLDENNAAVADTKVKIPAKFSIGGGIGETKKWMLGAEVTFLHNINLDNRFTDIQDVEFENSVRYSLGGYFIPNVNSFSSYFSKMSYRAGLRFENTGLVINNEPINDAALTMGIGLPLGGSFSNVNIGFELGKRGTTKAGLIAEKYANFTLALSLNDRWFVKRKFD